MIVTSPMRLSLAGGGTDLPEWYRNRPAHLLSVTVNLFVEVEVQPKSGGEPSSPLVRLFHDRNPAYSCDVWSDCSPGAGLGGSGALATALVAAEAAIRDERPSANSIAAQAFRWEREHLGEPVGFQDHFAAAIGGVVEMWADTNSAPTALKREDLVADVAWMLDHALLIVETPVRRSASTVLGRLGTSTLMSSAPADHRPASVKVVTEAIQRRDGVAMGEILLRHWAAKRRNIASASNPFLDSCVATALNAGGTGAKVIGAGGGGFLMIACPAARRQEIGDALRTVGCTPHQVKVMEEGTTLLKTARRRQAPTRETIFERGENT